LPEPNQALGIKAFDLVYAVVPRSLAYRASEALTSNCHATGLPWLKVCWP